MINRLSAIQSGVALIGSQETAWWTSWTFLRSVTPGFRNKITAQQEEHRVEVLFIPLKLQAQVDDVYMHIVKERCQILNGKGFVNRGQLQSSVTKWKFCKNVNYISGHNQMLKKWMIKAIDVGNCRNVFFCFRRFSQPPVCTERCWMYRLYSRLWQECFNFHSSSSWIASLLSSEVLSVWRNLADWGGGGAGCSSFKDLQLLNRMRWLIGILWMGRSKPFFIMT